MMLNKSIHTQSLNSAHNQILIIPRCSKNQVVRNKKKLLIMIELYMNF